ncbi:hypothetical protein [Streptomyces venezuelae]|uniref:hypothetical protein n=1 Tax=Streptomyces venezuelae TaxID=54571 RepID=UPI001CC25EEA|nr:hypothetical protein [Streptomyces venezuelae]
MHDTDTTAATAVSTRTAPPLSPFPPLPPEAVARARADLYARWAGLAAGAAAAWAVASRDDGLGIGILYAIPAFGLCAVAGVLLGDALTPPPRDPIRSAGLTPRRARDYVPPRTTRLLIAQVLTLLTLLIAAAVMASPDDQGRAGRTLSATCQGMTQTVGPWPGLFYGAPVLASLALGTAACAWSLRRIARRPSEEQPRRDRALAITAAWGLLVSTPLLGTTTFAAGALLGLDCVGASGSAWILVPVALSAASTMTWSLTTIVAPRAGRR